MLTQTFSEAKDFIHAQLCYQLFITPIVFPVEKKYREFAQRACEYFEEKRDDAIHLQHPRHHILHHFAQAKSSKAKKILITHGWMSRAAYMVQITNALHQQGFDVYVLDFPAHGEAKGFQLPWVDAVYILKNIINQHGPFYAVLGHSFGGSMLLNALNLSGQLPEWELIQPPEKAILIASPTRMRSPVHRLARQLGLSGTGYQFLRDTIHQHATIDPRLVRLKNFTDQNCTIPLLCVHGKQDKTVHPNESLALCNAYPHAQLALLQEANHVSVLMDERVEHCVAEFLLKS